MPGQPHSHFFVFFVFVFFGSNDQYAFPLSVIPAAYDICECCVVLEDPNSCMACAVSRVKALYYCGPDFCRGTGEAFEKNSSRHCLGVRLRIVVVPESLQTRGCLARNSPYISCSNGTSVRTIHRIRTAMVGLSWARLFLEWDRGTHLGLDPCPRSGR